MFLSGEAVVSLPRANYTATIHGGKHGIIVAADTAAVSREGHITNYASDRETIALQIPTAGQAVPMHTVLHEGPCTAAEQRS